MSFSSQAGLASIKRPSPYDDSYRPNHDMCDEHADGSWWFDFCDPCTHPEWHEGAA